MIGSLLMVIPVRLWKLGYRIISRWSYSNIYSMVIEAIYVELLN